MYTVPPFKPLAAQYVKMQMPQPTLIVPRRFGDNRGWFTETYRSDRFQGYGIPDLFVQDNEAFSAQPQTFRGLHFQRAPHAQAKLVRCITGSVLDILVDIRRGSPTFGQSHQVTLTAAKGEMIYVPVGYAHGYLTLTENTLVAYKVTSFYAPAHEGGVCLNDPLVQFRSDFPVDAMTINDRDRAWPPLSQDQSPFENDGLPFTLLTIEV